MRMIAGRNDVRSAVVFGNEVADGQAESSGQVVEPVDVHAGLAAFEFADEGPVEAGGVGQLLLGEVAFEAEHLEPASEAPEKLGGRVDVVRHEMEAYRTLTYGSITSAPRR